MADDKEPKKPRRRRKKAFWPVPKPHTTVLPTHLFTDHDAWFYLFHSLLALIVLYPYLETAGELRSPWMLTLLNSIVILTIIWAVSINRLQFFLGLLIGIPAIVTDWIPCVAGSCSVPFQLISLTSTFLLYLYAIMIIIPYLLHSEEIHTDELYGTASLYILLGLSWACLYQAIEISHPGSFHITDVRNLDAVMNWSDFLYFSFTTLTTLGYGDIAPITSQARSLSILEAFTGVIFIALMLSRAIGLHVTHTLMEKAKIREIEGDE